MFEPLMEKIKFKERFATDPRNIIYIYNAFTLLVHIILEICFILYGSYVMSIVNAFSICFYIILFFLIHRRANKLSIQLLMCEVILFTLLAVIFIGDYSCYSLYCIALQPAVCLYYYYEKTVHKNKRMGSLAYFFLASIVVFVLEQFIDYFADPVFEPLPLGVEEFICHINFLVLLLASASGSIILMYIAIDNTTKLVKALEETGYEAHHDYLTGLKNRKSMENFITRLNESNKTYAVIMGDVDRFKVINDTYGHDCGDYVLKVISKLMKESVTKEDRTYRWGGEELFAILPEASLANACKVAEDMRRKIEAYRFEYNNQTIQVTMTFGVAESNGRDFVDLEKEVDACMYFGKANGRNRVITSDMLKIYQESIRRNEE